MRGQPILGGREHIPELVREYKIQEIIIAIPSAPGRVVRQIVDACHQAGVTTRILPGLAELLNGDVSLRRLRSVQINDLVLQAAVLGRGGEVFVLDMGDPVRIVDLARDLIELSGLQVGEDIDIVFTGMRPGEKLFEELFVPGERYERTSHEKIFIAANASAFVPTTLEKACTTLLEAAWHNDADAILKNLRDLIPEFHPPLLETSVTAPLASPSTASK